MIHPVQPSDISFFLEIATSENLGVAAHKLGVSVAAVSKRLSQLEARLGAVLLIRTVRKLSLTPEGSTFLHHGRVILAELETMQQALSPTPEEPRGLLRINASLGFGRQHIAPAISSFTDTYPEVDVALTLSDSVPAMAENVCDISIRFGAPPDSRAIARLLSENNRLICASPRYLAAHGMPDSPMELRHHNCIDICQGTDPHGVWRFTPKDHPNGPTETIKIQSRLTTNDGAVAVAWALEGKGIVMRSAWDIAQYLERGELVRVLEKWSTPTAPIYAVYPEQHRRSPRVRAFTDFLVKRFAAFPSPIK